MDPGRGPCAPQSQPGRAEPTSNHRTSSGTEPSIGILQAREAQQQDETREQGARSRWPARNPPSAPSQADEHGSGAAEIVQALEIFKLFQSFQRDQAPSRFPTRPRLPRSRSLAARDASATNARPGSPFTATTRGIECKAYSGESKGLDGRRERAHRDQSDDLGTLHEQSSSLPTARTLGAVSDHQLERDAKRPKLHDGHGNGGPSQ